MINSEIKDELDMHSKKIETLTKMLEFVSEHDEFFEGERSAFFCGDVIYVFDAAATGEEFGRDGWEKSIDRDRINWTKEFEHFSLCILHAEDNLIDGMPVDPKAFPLALLES